MHWKSPLVLGEGFGHFLLSCPYITNPDLMTGSHFCSWASPSSKQDPCTDIWTLTSNFYHKFPLFIQVNSNKYDPGVVSSGNFPLQEDVSSKCRFLLQTTPWLIRIACRDRSSVSSRPVFSSCRYLLAICNSASHLPEEQTAQMWLCLSDSEFEHSDLVQAESFLKWLKTIEPEN